MDHAMSEPARNRFALDLDDLERQLRGAAQPPKAGASVDPLVELTRIVGQDDPLKELFAPRDAAAPAQPSPAQHWPQGQQRQEPAFDPAPAPRPAMANDSAPPAEIRGALDEFEALLRRTDGARPAAAAEQPQSNAVYVPSREPEDDHPAAYRYQQPEPAQPSPNAARDLDYGQGNEQYEREAQADYAEPPMMVEDDLRDLEPSRSRKGLWTAAALIAVAVIGVAGAMTFRGSSVSKDGQPPVIAADGGPTKVEPVNPGGTEVPNQNKQIYERAGESSAGATKVVSREEQPVDVQQAARMMAPRAVTPGSAAATDGNPLAQAPAAAERSANAAEPALTPVPAVPGLGEPRKVRTVSIRPDGTPAPPAGASTAYANGSAPLATGSAPRITANAPLNPASTASTNPPRRPAAVAEPPKAQERVATPAPETTPAAPVRTASADPAPAANAPRAGRGDYAVQLAAPGSESEARATFSALQRKYGSLLGGQSPIVRKTDLAGGKTVYRLRVGPYSREDATSMCSQLQAAGGQCFIAKN
jgi:hypothetical protein